MAVRHAINLKGICCLVVVFGWEVMVVLASFVLGSLGKSFTFGGHSENPTRFWVPFKNPRAQL